MTKVRLLSKYAAKLSDFNIFVTESIKRKIKTNNQYSIVPCGIDLETFYPIDMASARKQLGLNMQTKYILFSSGFDNPVKNSSLAFSSIELLGDGCELIELKNKKRTEVNLLLNACNLLLLTSISEGSPQIIKEAMACNCPVVATDVGDIRDVIKSTEGCFITSNDPLGVADKIKKALNFNNRTNGRQKISCFDNNKIAEKIYNIYQMVISN